METLATFFDQLIIIFQQLGVLAYVLLFVIAFLDSLIITGTFMNGMVFLLLAGVMASNGTHGFPEMAIAAAAGAICGGFTSYYLGYAGSALLKRHRRTKEKDHVGMSTQLFRKYGGFSVFIGRFLGPVSSVVAFVAGTLGLSRFKFIFWNVLAGLSWGVGYVTIGHTVGLSFSLESIL